MPEVIALANQIGHWISLEPELIDDDLLEKLLAKFEIDEDKFKVSNCHIGTIIPFFKVVAEG